MVREAAVDFVEYLIAGSGVSETLFTSHAEHVLTTLFTYATDDSRRQLATSIAEFMRKKGRSDNDESLRELFRSLRSMPVAQGVEHLNDVRRRWAILHAHSSVPIVAFVFSCSVVWATGQKLDFVVAPGAADANNPLSIGYMASAFPRILEQFLEQLALQGLDNVRTQEAYDIDDLRCGVLLQELDRFVQQRPAAERAAYAAIVDRIRLGLQVVDDTFFEGSSAG
jgi:hypothetical protein